MLDIACSTGAVTRRTAEQVETGRVVGLDLNDGMLAVARSVPTRRASIEWVEGTALIISLPFDDSSFDLVLCQLGL
jgi:ubiquinone/menaquinone biosynthesis C-methylase UbiE